MHEFEDAELKALREEHTRLMIEEEKVMLKKENDALKKKHPDVIPKVPMDRARIILESRGILVTDARSREKKLSW
ncbi:MAG: hypothetical protein IH823_03720 [Candidatus Dadabacteria bacterium]|nr:hypothetical protein [Candidatus Dadabacteria bacterium]